MRLNQRRSGSQYLRNDLSLVFNEAVSVWESFPFTTGENFLDEKVDRPGSCLGDVIYSRLAAATTARSTSTNQSHPGTRLRNVLWRGGRLPLQWAKP
jgi:hypothetical protein